MKEDINLLSYKREDWRPGDYTNKQKIQDSFYRDPTRYNLRGNALAKYSRGKPGEILRVGLELLDLRHGELVVDVGAGLGYFANLIQMEADVTTIAIDLSSAQASAGNLKYPTLSWCICDVEKLPFNSSSFDAACANFMLYHLAQPQIGLKEVARILHNQGRLLILTKGHNTYQEMDDWYRSALENIGVSDDSCRDESKVSELNIQNWLIPNLEIENQVCIESWLDFPDAKMMLDYFVSTPRYHYQVTNDQWYDLLRHVIEISQKDNFRTRKIEWAFLLRVKHNSY